jgi:hypothetical protein
MGTFLKVIDILLEDSRGLKVWAVQKGSSVAIRRP